MDHATDLIAEGIGLAILGPAGVGKSRVLHEVAARADESSMTVLSIVASASTRSIPFAPFVELLPAGPTQDELMMLTAARATLEQLGQSGGVVLAIDDAHQLDRVSLAFLLSVVSSHAATVVMTSRTGEPMPSDLVDLWTNGVVERIDLDPLDRGDVSSLLGRRLGPITPELEEELWRLTQGNPLVLHEMVEGAVGSSLSRDEHELWSLVGSVVESPRLSDLVLSRLSSLPAPLRGAMDIVAVGSPIPLEVGRLAIGEPLSELEERGLVQIVGRGVGRLLVPGHPLYGEILAASLGDLRRQGVYEVLTTAAIESKASNPDPLRAAMWQRDGGIMLSPEIAIAGSREALSRHDPELAVELLDPLDTADDEVAIGMGRSFRYLQRFAEAEPMLEGRSPFDPGLATEAASIRGQNLAFGLGRVADARAVFETAAGKIDDPDSRARLANERAMVSAVWGDFDDAMAASQAVLDDPVVSDVSRAAAYVTLTVALGMTGRSEEFAALVDDARKVTTRAAMEMPFARDQVEVMWAMALMNVGRFDDAIAVVERAMRERPNPLMAGTLLGTHALGAIEVGRLPLGLDKASEALAVQRRYDPFGLVPQSLGLIALARGQMGDPDGLADLEEIRLPMPAPRLTVWIERGRAWSTAAMGDLDAAARIALDGGRIGIAGEHFSWALSCLHDAVRFGRAEVVIDEIRSIDTSHGADYLAALQDHAEAFIAGDTGELLAVGRRFGEFGCLLLMAEAFARASRLLVESEDEIQAARACAVAKSAAAACGEARTPALEACPDLVSDREVQVAFEAAGGLTSPQIAERRFISVRTVDNHLRSVYRKLGVSGRDELAEVLAPAVDLFGKT